MIHFLGECIPDPSYNIAYVDGWDEYDELNESLIQDICIVKYE